MTTLEEKRIFRKYLSRVFLTAAIVYLITALFLDSNGSISMLNSLPGSGGMIGPVTVKQADTVVEIEIKQNLGRNNEWSFITGELLDANHEYLTGFGDELYYETGYDDEGRWTESENDYDNKLTIPNPGDYYFNFVVESNFPLEELPGMSVRIESKVGSSVPHFAAGMILLIIGALLNFFGGGILRTML